MCIDRSSRSAEVDKFFVLL